MSPRLLAAVAVALLAGSPAPARAAHVWRADRLPLSGDRFASHGGRSATMSVSVDIDDNVMRIDLETGAAPSSPRVVRIVGPAHGATDGGVRLQREIVGGDHVDWKFPEADQAEILGGRMVLAVDAANGEPLLRGRIDQLMDQPDRASTTLLTVLAIGFALLSVVVVTTQRKPEPRG